MAFDAGSISASLTLNISQFVSGINSAMSSMRQLGNGPGFSNIASSIDEARRTTDQLTSSMKDVSRVVGGILLSQTFYQGVAAIRDATDSVIQFSSDMEKAQISMEYFLGSKQAAQAYVATMQDFAAATAFSTDQVITLSRRLMGAGFDPSKVKDVMTILNDASSATGGTPEQMDRIVLALSEINATGKLAGKEIRQFGDAGIPIYQILNQQLGLTAKQLENVGKLNIPASTAIDAILKGLEEKYKGAGDKVANTFTGIISNIKDDALIISSNLFDAPFKGIQGMLSNFKNTLDKMRDTIRNSGVGGLMESLVPPELQDSVRLIAASVLSLGESFATLLKSLTPVVQIMAGGFTAALSTALPIVATIVRAVTTLISAALNASPALQVLVAAIGAMVIAQTAARALMLLWTVTRMGAICSVVAGAVETLTNALRALMVAMVEDPITALIILIAGALLYLALSSDKAQASIQGLMDKLGQLMGVKMGGILQPTTTTDLNSWADQFNKSVVDANANLQDTGKQLDAAGTKAKNAGKKVKDTFIASFDQVYQIPEKLDQVGTALDGIGSNFDPSTFKLPPLPDNTPIPPPQGKPGDGSNGQDSPSLPFLPPIITLPPIKFPPIDPPPPPNLAPITNAIATINSLIDALVKKLKDAGNSVTSWVNETGADINAWSASTSNVIKQWTVDTTTDIVQWVASTTQTVSKWSTDTANDIVQWSANTLSSLNSWATQQITEFTSWAASTKASITSWVSTTSASIAGWVTTTGVAIAGWVATTSNSFTSWVNNTKASVSQWVTNTEADFSSWSSTVASEVRSWASTTSSSITSWISSTEKSFSAWKTNVLSNFNTWATSVESSVSAFIKNTETNINNWAKTTATSIVKWASNTASNIVSWANGAVSATAAFASNAGKNIENWVSNTSSGISSWASSVLKNFGAFANGASSAVNSFAKNAWSAFNSWLSGTANGVYNWAQSVMGTLTSWAQAAWNTISKLAKAAGQTVSGSFDGLGASLSRASSSIGSWVGDNANWIIPVGIGAGVVAATVATVLTGGAAAPSFALLGLETGGIVDKEQIIRVGEKDRREAVIPLENSTYMKPFSAAVAHDLMSMLGGQGGSGSSQSTQPTFYVGTLIGDDRSLKELYRKINIIQQKENIRGGK